MIVGGGGGGGGAPKVQLTALPFVSSGWLKETCLPTTPSARSTPAVAEPPWFHAGLPAGSKLVSRYWNRTSPFSLMIASNVTGPLVERKLKCGTLNHST